METQKLFEVALGIKSPWFIKSVQFTQEKHRLDIYIDFKEGARFSYEEEENLKPYDTKKKTWKHLNFFEYETYLHARIPRVQMGYKIRLIKRHWDGVIAWASSRINNGILEGLNSMIQAAKRKARGFKSTKNLKIIAYLVTSNLNFKSVNKSYNPL